MHTRYRTTVKKWSAQARFATKDDIKASAAAVTPVSAAHGGDLRRVT